MCSVDMFIRVSASESEDDKYFECTADPLVCIPHSTSKQCHRAA